VTTAPAQDQGPSDAELIVAVRDGTTDAYATLYARHRDAAYNLARHLTRSQAEADDLVSEAFAKLLDTLRCGGGPESAFRAYLLTALRHCAYDRTRRDRRIDLTDDETAYDSGVPFTDTAVAGLDRSLAARAFATLPQRWQTVLWHTEIEGQSPTEVAPLLGLTPNGVSALAYRAREGLRQAYLQVHLGNTRTDRCHSAVERLGAWTRDGLSKRETAQVEQHLDECDSCRALAAELADVNGGLRVFVAPLVLGTATAAYLAAVKGGTVAAAVGVGAVATGTVTGSAASSAAGVLSAGPRQLLSVAGSTVALAAVVAAGLTVGPGGSVKPDAAADPAGRTPTSQSRSPVASPTPTTTPTAPGGTTPSTEPSTADTAPTDRPRTETPEPAALGVTAPTSPIELAAGEGAVELPVTVRNTGATTSEPVVARLSLPAGVTATGGGAGSERSAAEPSAPTASASCTGGTGSIECATSDGLAPGEQVVFVFTLTAGPDAVGGVVTGTVRAGGAATVTIGPVPVRIRSADSVLVEADQQGQGRFQTRLRLLAVNTGRLNRPVVVTVALPDGLRASTSLGDCEPSPGSLRCTATLAPGHEATWQAWLSADHDVDATATVTATLGTASQVVTVPISLRGSCPRPPGHGGSCPPGLR
jgi:RNA polymerase sigma factor (sigma-70 family)